MEMILLQFQSLSTVLLATAITQSWIYGILFKLVPFIIVLGLLIFFHELGHFWAAKIFGVKVERFSFGLGPRLVGLKVGDTDYRISALPLGGYVKMVGEGLDEEVSEEEKGNSFSHKPPWKRMVIVICGPLFNFFFAIVVFFLGFLFVGQVVLTSEIGEVNPDYPAYHAGLRSGDKISRIAGEAHHCLERSTREIMSEPIPGKPIPVIFVRGEPAI